MKATIYAVCNRKGGVGKTTTAHALGAGLSLKGKKTLLIDLDSQTNLTQAAGTAAAQKGAGHVLRGEATASETVKQIADNLYIMPGGADLARADRELTETGAEYKLKEVMAELLHDFDFIIADCPPSLGVITINALTAADRLIIPAQADFFSLQALIDLEKTLALVRKYTNAALVTDGILLTRHNPRNILTKDVVKAMEETAAEMGTRIYTARIREGVAIKEAQAMRKDIFTYAPRSSVAADYEQFIDELLKKPIRKRARREGK